MKNKERLWQQSFDTHYNSVYSFFLKRLDSPEDAADAAQEAFMRMVRCNGTSKLDSPGRYIWQTAQNMLKEIKRNKAVSDKWVSSGEIDLDQHTTGTGEQKTVILDEKGHRRNDHSIRGTGCQKRIIKYKNSGGSVHN